MLSARKHERIVCAAQRPASLLYSSPASVPPVHSQNAFHMLSKAWLTDITIAATAVICMYCDDPFPWLQAWLTDITIVATTIVCMYCDDPFPWLQGTYCALGGGRLKLAGGSSIAPDPKADRSCTSKRLEARPVALPASCT